MKHNLKAISILMLMFLAAQFIGLLVANAYNARPELPLNIERPVISEEQKSFSFVPIAIFVLIATGIVFLLFKLSLFKVWKFWFLLSVWLTLTISFNAFIAEWAAISLATVLAILKVFRNNVYIHNLTELFIYSALVAIFAPILNITSAIVLLLIISIYDYIAVRKTKHMVSLAEMQGKAKLFAGLLLPYSKGKAVPSKVPVGKLVSKKAAAMPAGKASSKTGVAILGGGDIGFPLLFAGVVMREMSLGLLNYQTYLIPLGAAIALFLLFLFGKDKKYYPAMPYITAGCLIGYGLLLIL